ncbi:Spy/CpxP family protein refolding chaperone [Maritalea mediterranea]|uniref:Spy/CpxP family protein refolding chaperone n=1 Tax=Maritalea mediterranea TaxID=2909667 RepID=A0ABS9EAW3_9HYPH|nr:Spy/CpxP family protein refolding chaperone [Maritalea mediterranea]MCF4099029.1 Spy/CpxP family protein refolding chaperone [Maritalea mediterranea]
MKKLSTLALTAAMVGTLAVSAMAPAAAYADNHGDGKRAEQQHKGKKGGHHRMTRGGHGFLGMICAPQGAEKAVKRLDKMAEKLQLTADQTSAFETLKATVTEAQADAAEACAPLKDNKPASPVDRMEKRQAIMQLQLDAMGQITPVFADFYETLNDEQKAELSKKGPKGKHTHDRDDDDEDDEDDSDA